LLAEDKPGRNCPTRKRFKIPRDRSIALRLSVRLYRRL
jgi:hypothetical protein